MGVWVFFGVGVSVGVLVVGAGVDVVGVGEGDGVGVDVGDGVSVVGVGVDVSVAGVVGISVGEGVSTASVGEGVSFGGGLLFLSSNHATKNAKIMTTTYQKRLSHHCTMSIILSSSRHCESTSEILGCLNSVISFTVTSDNT